MIGRGPVGSLPCFSVKSQQEFISSRLIWLSDFLEIPLQIWAQLFLLYSFYRSNQVQSFSVGSEAFSLRQELNYGSESECFWFSLVLLDKRMVKFLI